MAVGDTVGYTTSGSSNYQPAGSVEIMVSSFFADGTSGQFAGRGGINTGSIVVGNSGNYNHNGIGYMRSPVMPKMFLSNANYIYLSGSGNKGFTGIQIK
jgi:hypothetical protein